MPTLKRRRLAVISGTGMDSLFLPTRTVAVRTKHGTVRLDVVHRRVGTFYHLRRHGPSDALPPHAIDFRANIAALGKLGVSGIVSVYAVGSMNAGFKPGELGLLDQFIDFGQTVSFFEKEAVHTDMTNPYDRELQDSLTSAADGLGIPLHRGLVYASVTGPRYETAAEIRMMQQLGVDVVGMTGAPEAILANELQLKIASLVVATNWAAGIQEKVDHQAVLSVMRAKTSDVRRIVEAAASS